MILPMRTNSMRFMQACRDALFVLDGPVVMNEEFIALLLQRVLNMITRPPLASVLLQQRVLS